MLRVCAPVPPPPPLPPPQPVIPAVTSTRSIRQAKAYPRRLGERRLVLRRNANTNRPTTIQIRTDGIAGIRCGIDGGARKDSVVVSVAVQEAAAACVPAVGVQVTAVESELDPFLNCTVPVGPAPLLLVATVAVSIMLAPDTTLTGLVTCVAVAALVTVSVSATGPAALKLMSPE